MTLDVNAKRERQVDGLFVRQTQLFCQLIDTNLFCQNVLSYSTSLV